MSVKKYFNPYTDFGFKKLFGEEASKELLVDFLNQLLPEHHQIAELAHLSPRQYDAYQKSLLEYAEVKNVSDTSFEEGIVKGKTEEKHQIARNMLAKGFELTMVSELTGLTLAEVNALRSKN